MIQFDRVTFAYEKDHPVLRDLSFTVKEGEAVGLIGANGVGKSTLMKVLLGILPCQGKITVDGLPVSSRNLKEIRRKIGLVLQDSDNQMFMPTVWEDVLFAPLNYGMSHKEAEQRAEAVLEKLNLSELKHRYNHKISGGEKRMAAIATVLVMDPDVVLMDEPTSGLDPYNRRTVIHTILSLSKTRLIASHDLDMVLATCQRVILLSGGRIAAEGKAEEILKDKELLEANRMELPFCLQGAERNSLKI